MAGAKPSLENCGCLTAWGSTPQLSAKMLEAVETTASDNTISFGEKVRKFKSFNLGRGQSWFHLFSSKLAPVAEWLGGGLQNPLRRFESVQVLNMTEAARRVTSLILDLHKKHSSIILCQHGGCSLVG